MAGNALTSKGYGYQAAGRAVAGARLGRLGSTGSTSTGIGAAARPRLERDRSAKNSQIARPTASSGSAISAPTSPSMLGAGEQAEDHEQRVQAQRAPHHLRHDDVALDLVDAEEEQHHPDRRERVHDERVDQRRDRAEPRARGTGSTSVSATQRAEEQRVVVRAGQEPGDAEDPEAEPGARADDQAEQRPGRARTRRARAPSARAAAARRAAESAGRRRAPVAACRAACRSRSRGSARRRRAPCRSRSPRPRRS